MKMNPLSVTLVVGLLAGAWANVIPAMMLPNEVRPACDSPDIEAAALVAQDYLNAQHTHGYKYVLNRIEDIKILSMPNGDDTYLLEIDLLETSCHALDPTPVANCSVRPKVLTAVEGDCDVVLKKVGGVLTVTAFKCKTEESTEDLCLGCPALLPLNDTAALDFVHASLKTFNNATVDGTFALLEVGRMSSQIVSGGRIYAAEYVIVEANCTDNNCMLLTDPTAKRGFCSAKGLISGHNVDCNLFATLIPLVDANSTAAADPVFPPAVHVHTGNMTFRHGLRHHKLTALHDPELSGLLSAESAESGEVLGLAPAVLGVAPAVPAVPVAADPAPAVDVTLAVDPPVPAEDSSASIESPAVVVKREAPAPDAAADIPAVQAAPISLVPLCPGKLRYY
ncbi:alpha-2-HS-glycoprotein 2 [Polymixia lowei]